MKAKQASRKSRSSYHLLVSSILISQDSPLAIARSLPVKILSATNHSALLWPPAPTLDGILKTDTSREMNRVCSI